MGTFLRQKVNMSAERTMGTKLKVIKTVEREVILRIKV